MNLNHFSIGTFRSGEQTLPCRVPVRNNVLYLMLNDAEVRANPVLFVDAFVRDLFRDASDAGYALQIRHYDRSLMPQLPGAMGVARFDRYRSVSDLDFRAMVAEMVEEIRHRSSELAANRQSAKGPLVLLVGADSFGNENNDVKDFRERVEQGLSALAHQAGVLIIAYGRKPNAVLRALESAEIRDGFQTVSLQWIDGWKLEPAHHPLLVQRLGYEHQMDIALNPADAREAWRDLVTALEEEERASESNFLSIPVGRDQAGDAIYFKLGETAGSYHAMIVGTSGSGKSTLLNTLILGIAEQYDIDELELYLADLKQGVEFQHFAEHPNCRAVFLGAERLDDLLTLMLEFTGEINKRGALFREAGVSSVSAYNASHPEHPIPHILLIVDEAHELFVGGWKQSREFEAMLLNVVRQGRSFGIHIIMSTQTLKGSNISSSIMSQVKLRVAFKLAANDVYGIFSDVRNDAPTRLGKYQFIYNNDDGIAAANVVVDSLPPREIQEVIAGVNASRAPGRRLVARVITGKAAGPAVDILPGDEGVPDTSEAPPLRPAREGWRKGRLGEL